MYGFSCRNVFTIFIQTDLSDNDPKLNCLNLLRRHKSNKLCNLGQYSICLNALVLIFRRWKHMLRIIVVKFVYEFVIRCFPDLELILKSSKV